MVTNDCPSPEELSDFNLGLLDESRIELVGRHLDSCSVCRDSLITPPDAICELLGRPAQETYSTPEIGLRRAFSLVGRLGQDTTTDGNAPLGSDLTTEVDKVLSPPGSGEGIGRLGAYIVLEVVGHGGMGIVFRALDPRLGRIVAVKVLRPHLAHQRLMRERFLAEARAVAVVRHDNIIPIYETGEADGRPYFAMAFVKGRSLASEVAAGPLQPKRAALLIRDAAQAIAFTHGQGIIHRDLKPGNLLVDAVDRLFITDFGLAKHATVEDIGQGLTQTGQVLGTPQFMSPEQAEGSADRIGPLSDVYALGATLYCLLTGRPPFQAATALATLEQVVEREPAAPRLLNPAVPLDLETICLKCLEKAPHRRYPAAETLADDLDRFLDGRPITARPVGPAGRLARWAKRNPSLAWLSFSVAVLVVGIVAASVLAAIHFDHLATAERSAREREGELLEAAGLAQKKAEAEAETALAISEFLGGLFDDADPIARTGRAFGAQRRGEGPLTALEVVNRGAVKLKTAMLDKPLVRAALLDRVGNVYLSLDRSADAEPLLREALDLRQRELDPDHIDVAASLQSLGLLQLSRGEVEKAAPLLEQALAYRRKHLVEGHPLVADTLFHLGVQRLILYDFNDAERYLNECLTARRRLADGSREVAVTLLALAHLYALSERPAQAIPALTEAAAIFDKIEGRNDFSAMASLFVQGQVAKAFGNSNRAVRLVTEAIDRGIKVLGEDHHIAGYAHGYLGEMLYDQGEPAAAAACFRKSISVLRKTFGSESTFVANRLTDLARVEHSLGNHKEAETLAREAVRVHRLHNYKQPGTQNRHIWALRVLGSLLLGYGRPAEAEVAYREALVIDLRRAKGNPEQQRFLAHRVAQLQPTGEGKPFPTEIFGTGEPRGRPSDDLVRARIWAQAGKKFASGRQRLSADDELVLSYLQERAVECLRSAVVKGHRDLAAIEKDEELATLRQRQDYRRLLGEMR